MSYRVSFDFDGTLDKVKVQNYAKELIQRGFEVYICTSRLSDDKAPSIEWNKEVWKVVESLGIKKDNVIFCNNCDKSELLETIQPLFHLDDEWYTVKELNDSGVTICISLFGNPYWKEEIEQLIKERIN